MRPPPGQGRGLALRSRVFLLMGVGVLGPGALLVWALRSRLGDLDARNVTACERAAGAVAGQLDEELTIDLETLQRAASAPHVDLEDADPGPERSALRDLYMHEHFPESVFFLSSTGAVVAEEPARGGRTLAPGADAAEVQEVLRSGRPAVTVLISTGGSGRAYALVPVRNWEGRVVGIAGGVVETSHERFTRLLRYLKRGADAYGELVDRNGRVLASTDRSHVGQLSQCRAAGHFASMREPQAAPCADCHRGRGTAQGERAILVSAPLSAAPWAVLARLPEQEVLASVGAFSWGFWGTAAVLLALGAFFSWGAARSVTRPLAQMTGAAERIAEGDLTRAIPYGGRDEVGRLGYALEVMRWSLQEMTAEVRQTREQLERRVAERTAELERVNARLREREQSLAHLYEKVVSAQEEERKRIARELHDDTSQSLAVLAMGIDSASAAVKAGLTPRLEELKALAVHAIEEVHRLVLDLRPSVLDDLGLLSAIRWYAERYLEARGISVRCEFEKLERRLPPAFETALFRVCQEAMSNVLRHAQAEAVLVQVAVKGETLHIEIEDDGTGFDPAQAEANSARPSFGLIGIRERVELLGGRVRIDSAPGQGTRLQIEVPLPREA